MKVKKNTAKKRNERRVGGGLKSISRTLKQRRLRYFVEKTPQIAFQQVKKQKE